MTLCFQHVLWPDQAHDQGAIAKDPKTSAKEKEACLVFVEAEGKLDKEDCTALGEALRCYTDGVRLLQDVDGCLSLSKSAVEKFEARRAMTHNHTMGGALSPTSSVNFHETRR